MKSIVLNVSQKCNAQCKHCCFSCSPNSKNGFNEQELNNILNAILSNKEIKVVSITGGEPLINKNRILDLIVKISDSGKEVTLITNGFWATSTRRTKKILQELVTSGLRYLTISFDDYHAEFIPVENIKRLLTEIANFPITVAINMVVDKKNTGLKILSELGESVFGVQITMVPASPVGNAKQINIDDLYLKDFSKHNLDCPSSSWEIVIHHDGYVYPCCSPSVFETDLRVGNIRTESLEEIDQSLFSNIALYILQKEGLEWFIKQFRLEEEIASKKFVSTCEICRYIFTQRDLSIIYREMIDYYEQKIC